MDKYLFLDFDGVISTHKAGWKIDDEKVKLLQQIIDATGCKIVITSSWRSNTLELTKSNLHYLPFIDDVVGQTIRGASYVLSSVRLHIPRGVEIKQWIDAHIYSNNGEGWDYKEAGEDFQYAILDDDSDMLLEQAGHFVKTDTYEGLTEEDVRRTIAILNSEIN